MTRAMTRMMSNRMMSNRPPLAPSAQQPGSFGRLGLFQKSIPDSLWCMQLSITRLAGESVISWHVLTADSALSSPDCLAWAIGVAL